MRKAVDKIVDLYKTQPLFQDFMETAAGSAVAATGQALFTDMSPEEIALSTAMGFGAATVGRPIVGRAGQAVGGMLDKARPGTSAAIAQAFREGKGMEMYPDWMKEATMAKMNPYRDLGGFAQTGQLLGRNWGDNVAQGLVALASPMFMNNNDGGMGNQQTIDQLGM